jgi:hypothetical protein
MAEELIEDMDIKTLADKLPTSTVRELFVMKSSVHMVELHKTIQDQAYGSEDILSRYTRFQYVQQEIEVGSLVAVFRTIPPLFEDECVTYAIKNANDNRAIYDRMLARRRLSYGLVSIGGTYIGGMPTDGSYHEMAQVDRKAFMETIGTRANKVMDYLELSGMTQRLVDVFLAWEAIIFNRLNGIEDIGAHIKKSTPISQSAQ